MNASMIEIVHRLNKFPSCSFDFDGGLSSASLLVAPRYLLQSVILKVNVTFNRYKILLSPFHLNQIAILKLDLNLRHLTLIIPRSWLQVVQALGAKLWNAVSCSNCSRRLAPRFQWRFTRRSRRIGVSLILQIR